MDVMAGGGLGLILLIVILGGLFYVFRGLMLWYWRISDIIDRLDVIVTELKRLK